MISQSFSVRCTTCGHVNQPERGAEAGIKEVLNGDFNSCRRCKTRFATVIVPNRPIVKRLVENGYSVTPHVKIMNYSGKVPMAVGMR